MMRARLTALFAAMAPLAAPVAAQTLAITGGTVYPVSGPKLEHATVLVRDGKIVAVGADVAVPDGAARLDATGKVVTPGLFQANSDYGVYLLESGDGGATDEVSRQGDINAAFDVGDGLDPAAVTIPVGRGDGITTALVRPRGGLVSGQAVVVDLAGDRLEDLIAAAPAAMAADLSQASKDAGGGTRGGAVERLRRLLDDAREFQRHRADFRRAQMEPLAASAADLEALQPVLAGTEPLYVQADRRSDIENALRLAQEYRLKLVILGGAEAWTLADRLARAHVPVAVDPRLDVPTFERLQVRMDNAVLLERAGVPLLLTQGPSVGDPTTWRDLRTVAGMAVSYGLDWNAALRAVTLAPAEAFGVADRYGSLAPGKVADIVVWSGDPFEFSSMPEHVVIRGRDIPLGSRQSQLFERYRTLPPSY